MPDPESLGAYPKHVAQIQLDGGARPLPGHRLNDLRINFIAAAANAYATMHYDTTG